MFSSCKSQGTVLRLYEISNIVGTNDVGLTATGGGLGFTIGSKSEKSSMNEQTLDRIGSTIGSVSGNVNITAATMSTAPAPPFSAAKTPTSPAKTSPSTTR
ncbi:hypothetical protein [Methylomusa anaerophila]|uniref:hypothetical protein n=1 Tax=Methylomusa anaerophila TaxID=1930071 RepID=UPI000F817D2E|nr:hypothetical protein [Methylomusa anaerophila]